MITHTQAQLLACLVVAIVLYYLVAAEGRGWWSDERLLKCSNKSRAYLHANMTASLLEGNSPFLPGSTRKGVALYTVFCGASDNRANVVAIPTLPFPHYFISDNDAVGKLAVSRGWTFIGMLGAPDADETEANMKCKLPRTLPNLFGELDLFKYLFYVDSKRAHTLSSSQEALVSEIFQMQRHALAMTFNPHNFIKGDIWEEFEVATQHQARYRRHKTDYQKYIQTRLQGSTLSGIRLLCGCFSLRDMDHPMTAIIGMNWYAEILKSGIEDQISLSFVYDRYKEFIGLTNHTIGW